MRTFLFFIQDEKLVILDKDEIDTNKLDSNIYKKLDIEIQAENEKDAIKKLKKENTDKYNELKEFISDVTFSSIISSFLR
ncbi:hypothetical protein [Gilliamella sp. ESL0405]|uniref:hypothetical protein n=1 Tax=Gilliamella sp. ESL0405 TaxID=2704653 RepID=UPI001C6A8D60|nr:hypothetical protein [Gilliamella sp. ESL0405]QYN46807.1 hypothetical protein GYM74_06200 [Gilliamella sp. ESL0405]